MNNPTSLPRQFIGGTLMLVGCALFGVTWWIGLIVLVIGVVLIDMKK